MRPMPWQPPVDLSPPGMRQESERIEALARISPPSPGLDRCYAACSSAHTSPHRSWNRRR